MAPTAAHDAHSNPSTTADLRSSDVSDSTDNLSLLCTQPDGLEARGVALPHDRATWPAEVGRLKNLALPLAVQGVLGYTGSLLALAFVGHLHDPTAFAGTVLANSLYNMSGWCFMAGLASGLETFCGQAYGSKNYQLLGLSLQRGLLVCFCACLPVSLLWTRTEQLLLLAHQAPATAELAGRYMVRLVPSLWFVAIIECLKRYLTAQNVVVPGMVITGLITLLSPIFYWVLIFQLGWGIEGAAYAFNCTQGTMALLYAGYTAFREVELVGSPMQTWPGWSGKALAGWGPYLKLALPATVMGCMEWWLFELLIFMSGYMPNSEASVGVMGVAFQISAWTYMLPMALGVGTNTRVANELGAGRPQHARLAATVGVVAAGAAAFTMAVLLVLLRWPIAELLCPSRDAIRLILAMVPVLAFTFVGDGMNASLFGVLRASGRQLWGAAMSLASYWLMGFPLAIFLGFCANLGVLGLWSGILAATSSQAIVCSIILCTFDWQLEVKRAQELVCSHAEDDEQIREPLLAVP